MRKVNKKPNKAVGVVFAVIVALLVAFAAVIAFVLMYEAENPNEDVVSNYFSTNAEGFYIATNSDGEEIVVEPKKQISFLVLGKDRAAFNTDVMILATYDMGEGAITMMQIPRDTYIEVFDGATYRNHKANSLLATYYNTARRSGASDPMNKALGDLKDSLSDVFGFPINYYVMVELDGFVKIIDGMGGVEMDVPFRMKYSDPEQDLYIDIQPGKQVLSGKEAEEFIRFRADYIEGDIGRVDAQKIFISACIAQLKKNFNVSTISNIAEAVFEHVETNLPIQDMISYAKSALSVDLGKTTMLTLPGIQVRQYGNSGTWYYIASREGTIKVVNKYFFPFNTGMNTSKFDANGCLYDSDGTYMHRVYLTDYAEESYSADNVDDIRISSYNSKVPGKTTTKNPPPIVEETKKADKNPTKKPSESDSESTYETDMTEDVHTEVDITDDIDVSDNTTDISLDTEESAETFEEEMTSTADVTEAEKEPEETEAVTANDSLEEPEE